MSVCGSYLKFTSPFIFITLLISMIDTCTSSRLSFKFHLTIKIDLVVGVYYLKQLFQLLCDKCVSKECFGGGITLAFLNIIDSCVMR